MTSKKNPSAKRFIPNLPPVSEIAGSVKKLEGLTESEAKKQDRAGDVNLREKKRSFFQNIYIVGNFFIWAVLIFFVILIGFFIFEIYQEKAMASRILLDIIFYIFGIASSLAAQAFISKK